MSSRSRIKERRQEQARRRRLTWALIAGGAAVAVAALFIIQGLGGTVDVVEPEPFDWPQADGNTLGDPDAPVTIVEYSDFQCPFCRRFHTETLPLIVDNYVRQGDVYFVYNNFPFIGRESIEAGTAALCAAEQDAFWPYAEIIFANQTGENVGAYTEAKLQAMAEVIGLDMDEFERCSSRNETQTEVQAQYAQGLDAGVSSTPTFVVNGQIVQGALPYAQFESIIEAELAGG